MTNGLTCTCAMRNYTCLSYKLKVSSLALVVASRAGSFQTEPNPQSGKLCVLSLEFPAHIVSEGILPNAILSSIRCRYSCIDPK